MKLDKTTVKRILFILCSVVLFTYFLFNFGKVLALGKWVLRLLTPFIIGFGVAFIVNVPMKGFEGVLFKNEKSKLYRFKRPVCILLSLLCIAAVLTFVITRIVPEVSTTINSIGDKFPDFMTRIKDWALGLSSDYPKIKEQIMKTEVNWDKVIESLLGVFKSGSSSILSSTFTFASSLVGVLVDIGVGLFFGIYILAQKETLEKQTKALLYASVKEKVADKIIRACAMADQTFTNFVSGQCLEACILGVMFFITMSVFSIPYALTVSITIAVTALIPVFGSFVGCGLGAFLILVDEPEKVILFLIVFIVLQQIEGNLIYPHVVGGSVGLPSIWVLVAVIIGGDLMGILGMLVFVPLMSVVYALTKEFVTTKIAEKNIDRNKYAEKCVIVDTIRNQGKPKKRKRKNTIADEEDEVTRSGETASSGERFAKDESSTE